MLRSETPCARRGRQFGAVLLRRAVGAVLALAATTVASCGRDSEPPSGPSIVATTGMIGDTVHRLLDAEAEVRVLMGAQVDPHLYSPTRQDVQWLQSADLILYNGLHLEGRMGGLLEQLAQRESPRVLAVAESLGADRLLAEPDSDTADPHVWLDAERWSEVVDSIAAALTELLPESAVAIEGRRTDLKAEIARLHEYGQEVMARVPAPRRVLVTSHDAFRYFGLAYGLEVFAVQGISTESDPGVRDVNELVDLVVDRRIPAVFVESSVSPRTIEALREGASRRGHDVRVGGKLYSDAMGEPGTTEGTYVGMLAHNLRVVANALGSVPPAPSFFPNEPEPVPAE